jgi:hypothetical protein
MMTISYQENHRLVLRHPRRPRVVSRTPLDSVELQTVRMEISIRQTVTRRTLARTDAGDDARCAVPAGGACVPAHHWRRRLSRIAL